MNATAGPVPGLDPAAAQDGPRGGGRVGPGYERMLVIGGTAVGVVGGAGTAVIEAFYTPLRIGSAPLPVAPALAIVCNAALVWFTFQVTRRNRLALLPGAVWLLVMALCVTGTTMSGRTTEGDIVFLGDNWMALATIVAGSLAWAGVAASLVLSRRPPLTPPPVVPAPPGGPPAAG